MVASNCDLAANLRNSNQGTMGSCNAVAEKVAIATRRWWKQFGPGYTYSCNAVRVVVIVAQQNDK
jgi:hypothetical protein